MIRPPLTEPGRMFMSRLLPCCTTTTDLIAISTPVIVGRCHSPP